MIDKTWKIGTDCGKTEKINQIQHAYTINQT